MFLQFLVKQQLSDHRSLSTNAAGRFLTPQSTNRSVLFAIYTIKLGTRETARVYFFLFLLFIYILYYIVEDDFKFFILIFNLKLFLIFLFLFTYILYHIPFQKSTYFLNFEILKIFLYYIYNNVMRDYNTIFYKKSSIKRAIKRLVKS